MDKKTVIDNLPILNKNQSNNLDEYSDSNSDSNSNESDELSYTSNDEGETILIDYLKNGFDWGKYVTTVIDEEKDPIIVTEDYIPSSGGIKEKYVVSRCKYLELELSKENKEMTHNILESHQRALRSTLKGWIQQFWVEMCPYLNITCNDGCTVENFNDFQTAVRQIKSRDEAKKFSICLYVCFDFCRNFRKKIARCLIKQYGFKVDKKKIVKHSDSKSCSTKRKKRKLKDCFEKLVSQILTDQRKNVNNMSIITCGFSFTSQRSFLDLDETNETKFRKKKKFYDWMVLGDLVSMNMMFNLFIFFLSNITFDCIYINYRIQIMMIKKGNVVFDVTLVLIIILQNTKIHIKYYRSLKKKNIIKKMMMKHFQKRKMRNQQFVQNHY